jgi:hypothetical protein
VKLTVEGLAACHSAAQRRLRGGLLLADMFAHNNTGIAYKDRNRRPETVADDKREPHQQPSLCSSTFTERTVSPALAMDGQAHCMFALPDPGPVCLCEA